MTRPNGQVHPAAEAYRLLAADELQELADDIRANGLLFPIVLDAAGAIVDGRNRFAACQLAGVEPTYTVYAGDPAAYVVSVNGHRRQLTQGQKAMGIVLVSTAYSQRALAAAAGVSQAAIKQAAIVQQYAPELALGVRDGALTLTSAYETACAVKRAQQNAALADADVRRARERLRRALDDVGPSVPIPPPPAPTNPDIRLPALAPRLARIDAEHAYAQRLTQIKTAIAELAVTPVVLQSMPGLSLAAAQSWCSQVVTLAYQIVEQHQAAYTAEQGLRAVEPEPP
jgi:ParB-like chromosome segregation protein Spo0J